MAEENKQPEAASAEQAVVEETVLVPRAEFEKLNEALKEKDQLLADKEKELSEFKDKYLRSLAEAENARKRLRQQSEETVRLQRENLLREFLPIVDNLERAVEAAQGGGNGKSIVEGVEMVLRSMHDFLRSQGVSQISTLGQPFDPTRHEAIALVDSTQHEPNTVIDEHHRGYQIGERLLRPARVSVTKAPPAPDDGGQTGGDSKDEVEKH